MMTTPLREKVLKNEKKKNKKKTMTIEEVGEEMCYLPKLDSCVSDSICLSWIINLAANCIPEMS